MHEGIDPLGLENLHDVVAPGPVPFEIAPGWWVVLAMVAALLLVLAHHVWRSRRASAYRRAALRELTGANARNLPSLLKRVALAVYPRAEVAPLSGERWIAFLNREVPGSFDGPTAELLLRLDYAAAPTDDGEIGRVESAVRVWIEGHP